MNVVVLSPVEQSVSLRATLDMPYFRKNVLMLKGSTLVMGDSAMHWRIQKVNASQRHSLYVSMYVCVCVCASMVTYIEEIEQAELLRLYEMGVMHLSC
jgi:hypothetical protein